MSRGVSYQPPKEIEKRDANIGKTDYYTTENGAYLWRFRCETALLGNSKIA
jgi:hypothetical protein